MTDDKERYYDFSEDEKLLAQFDPDDVSGFYLKWTGDLLQKYLQLRNPASRIAGLIAHHSAISTGLAMGVQSSLTRIGWLLVVNAALLAYIAYVLT
jgi:hypothetical protein